MPLGLHTGLRSGTAVRRHRQLLPRRPQRQRWQLCRVLSGVLRCCCCCCWCCWCTACASCRRCCPGCSRSTPLLQWQRATWMSRQWESELALPAVWLLAACTCCLMSVAAVVVSRSGCT
ncbi:hypothetical protein COO60DRAFT_1701695 [Scenedesmus sp. NREL 46B-D3]|nr:hypothetical protein COO60DRAFT_1701695 [Scenedesmus sp. NREL 46B-D3]